MSLFASIEAGGTKFMLGVGSAERGSIATKRVETRDPDATFADVHSFFGPYTGDLAAVGIASFGPLDLEATSPTYGSILATPKAGWSGVNLVDRFKAMLGTPVAIDTDVNAAALAEAHQGAGRGRGDLAYVTVGTGIGVGLIVNGRPVHGRGHPELGHLIVRRAPGHGDFAGVCPYHGDCLEGLASGTAIHAAWGAGLDQLSADHPAWAVEADYLGQLCATLILAVSPPTIVLGGGVLAQRELLPLVRARTSARLAGYIADTAPAQLAERIVSPGCVEPPGLVGGYLLAEAKAELRDPPA